MAGRVRFETRPGDGKERIRHWDGEAERYVYVHRLALYAWSPEMELDDLWAVPEELRTSDPRTDKLGVHHRMPIPWLNAEWNLEWQDPNEHGRIEADRRQRDQRGRYAGPRVPAEAADPAFAPD